MNTESPSSTPQDYSKAGGEITAQPTPHVENTASVASAPVHSDTGSGTSPNISSGIGMVDPSVALSEISVDLHNQTTQGGASANLGLVHVLKAVSLVSESPAIAERAVHHLEAGSNRPKPPQQEHPTPQQDAADLVLARIYPESNVPSRHTGTMIYDKFKKEWDRDPELVKMKRPSKSTVLRKLGKKKH
jgi:hypothetical protein